MGRKRQRYVLHNLLEGILILRHLKHFIEVFGKVYVDARINSNIIIHVINKNRLNGKLEILH
jgi:hypothetical protein